MAVKETPKAETPVEPEAIIPTEPGFYVEANGIASGPFDSLANAAAHATGHLEPQGIDFTITEVK